MNDETSRERTEPNAEPAPRLTPRALERRLKRSLRKATHAFMAPCAPGFEDVLRREVTALPDVLHTRLVTGGVEFEGPLDTLYHANLRLRTAHRVLLRIDAFLARTHPMLFDHARRIPWELYLGFSSTYAVRVSARESRLQSDRGVSETIRAAIEDAVAPLGLEPRLEPGADVEFHVRLHQDRCTVSVNTSGGHLHRRGYRQATAKAPIRETLAAGVLLAAGASEARAIVDPMCGSGTFLLEAAWLARGVPPGSMREFAFEALPFHMPSKWERFRNEAILALDRQNVEGSGAERVRLIGNDVVAGALRATEANAERAGVTDLELSGTDVLEWEHEALRQPGTLLVSNLPYGVRVGPEASGRAFHAAFARWLSSCGVGRWAIVTPHAAWLEEAGLRVRERRAFRNGGIAVSLLLGPA